MRPPPPDEMIAIATAVLVLALAVMFARAVRGTGPSRPRRILVPAATFVLGAALVMGVPSLFFSPPLIAWAELGEGAFWLFMAVLALALAADGVATILSAERTARWLGAGLVAAILITYGGLTLLTAGFIFAIGPVAVTPALVAAAAVITWWPYLPRPEGEWAEDDETSEVFD